jgi:hypothetical protein
MNCRVYYYLYALLLAVFVPLVGAADCVCSRCSYSGTSCCEASSIDCVSGVARIGMCWPNKAGCCDAGDCNSSCSQLRPWEPGCIFITAPIPGCSAICSSLADATLQLCQNGSIGGCPEGYTLQCEPEAPDGGSVESQTISGASNLSCGASCKCRCPRVARRCVADSGSELGTPTPNPNGSPPPSPTSGPRTSPTAGDSPTPYPTAVVSPWPSATPHTCSDPALWCPTAPSGCCNSGDVCLGTGCCSYDAWAPLSNRCCTGLESFCGGYCCSSGDVCLGNRGCCNKERVCGFNCCGAQETCHTYRDAAGQHQTQCCPNERSCGELCCPSGKVCQGGECIAALPTPTPTPTLTPDPQSPGISEVFIRQ